MEKPTMKVKLIAALMLVLSLTSAFAQTSTYRLQPDDLIRIQVYRTSSIASPDRSSPTSGGKDGNISAHSPHHQGVGKTTAQLEEDLAREYTKRLQLKNPIVSVTITKYRTVRATVGDPFSVQHFRSATRRYADFALEPGRRHHPDVSDLRRATLRRSGSDERIPIDLYAMLNQGHVAELRNPRRR